MSRTVGEVTVVNGLDISGATFTNTGTITFPTSTTTLVGTDTSDTLTNKTLTAPVISSITNTGTLTLPTSTTTLVGTDTSDTLTNKTINDTTNDIGANALRNGATWNVTMSGAAPSTDQVLAYNGTNAVWQAQSQSVTSGTVQTTDATVTTLQTISTSADTTYIIEASIVASNDTGDEAAAYVLTGCFRNTGVAISQVGTTDRLQFEDVAAWDATLTISGTDVLIRVTGEAAKTIDWKSSTVTVSV